jgi:hypothetical protein
MTAATSPSALPFPVASRFSKPAVDPGERISKR